MANKFSELRSRMSPQAQAQAADKATRMLAEMPLNELRQARGLSQKNAGRCTARPAAVDRQNGETHRHVPINPAQSY